MGLFNRKDWNIVAVMFERHNLYQVSGQRAKGAAADKAREGARSHPRTIYWAAFDQKGAFVDGGPGPGEKNVPPDVLKRMDREIRTNRTVLDILRALETKQSQRLAKPLEWTGYPKKPEST